MSINIYENSKCWKCGKKYDSDTFGICDMCGDTTCKEHTKEDGRGMYFCQWSCCKEFHRMMKGK